MTKVGIMQPYFFPYFGFWQLMNIVDKYVVYDDVNYIKNGWINRNNILINGKKHLFTLALSKANPFHKINETEILSNADNRHKVLSCIRNSYLKAPHFKEVFPLIEEIINYPDNNLAKYLFNQIKQISQYLGMTTEIILSSDIEKDNELKAQAKVICVCKVLKATQYFNAIGGQELYSKEDFEKEGIKLNFVKMKEFEYKQFNNEFVSNLSIIDVMMFNNKEEILKMFNLYELI